MGVHRSRTGPDRTGLDRRSNSGRLWTEDRTGPDRSRIGLLLSNSAALQTCIRDLARSDRATSTAVPLQFSGHGLPVPHSRAAYIQEKDKKILLKFGPSVQLGTGPKTEFSKITDWRPDRRGPVRAGPISDWKLYRPILLNGSQC